MRSARPGLDGIVDEALALLDEMGLPDLSMRRLAGRLGVQPSALYWHVDSKQAMLAALADRILDEAPPAEGVAATARALRGAILAHRDGAEVVLSSAALALGGDAARERLAAAFRAEGRDERAATVTLQFLLGHASLVQQRMQAAELGIYEADPAAVAAETLAEFDAGIARLIA
ncbi:TetR family transcriptional regulator [Microbacterium indicum]|uniref:TetR family transcriptional regulator n=1 Tax=Microbacterium indicum TaxID=358100 RepID=UPI00048B76D1|nr:TetR family transcriptional regulator [Microbacterium indicum]